MKKVHELWIRERQLIGLVHRMGHQLKCRQTVNRRTARVTLLIESVLGTRA